MFFLYFTMITIGIILILRFSKFQIEFKKIKISADAKKVLLLSDYEVLLKIYILKKIKILDKKIRKDDFKSKKILNNLQDRLKIKEIRKKSNWKILSPKNIKDLNVILKNTNFNIGIETEDAAVTGMLVGFSYAIIPNFLNYFFQLHEDINLKVETKYENKNKITLSFDGIFEIDLIHIINTYKVLIVKDKEGKNNGTSDRKSYAYNDE